MRPHDKSQYSSPPIYKGSTMTYENVAVMEASQADPLKRTGPVYGRFGTPTVRAFEDALTELEGGHAAVATCSGLSAITTSIMAFVVTGDHILVSDSVYLPTRNFCESLRAYGIETEYYDPRVGAGLRSLIRSNTRLVYLESPGSLTFEVQDVPAITAICKQAGVITILDNTWATPIFHKPLLLGVDVSVHSATKYIMGHSDGILGAIVSNESCDERVRRTAIRLGQCVGSEDAYSASRGLKTLRVRLAQHEGQALELASWLHKRPEVSEVFHPAMGRDRTIWQRDFAGSSGLFSFVLKPDYSQARPDALTAMLDSLRCFGLGHSWGGCESLIAPANPGAFRTFNMPTGQVLRVHVGLENMNELKADLENGFEVLKREAADISSRAPQI